MNVTDATGAFCQHHCFKLFRISTLVDTCLNNWVPLYGRVSVLYKYNEVSVE